VLIWALIWINVVGLGPFAGLLAIACSDVGALGKLARTGSTPGISPKRMRWRAEPPEATTPSPARLSHLRVEHPLGHDHRHRRRRRHRPVPHRADPRAGAEAGRPRAQ
jgi:hypothetical protein